jgi:hypothetical protein
MKFRIAWGIYSNTDVAKYEYQSMTFNISSFGNVAYVERD